MAKLHQLTVRIEEEDFQKMQYWANKKGMSLSEYITAAVDLKIRWDVQDYDLPPLEIQRLNQLIDVITILSENQKSLESVVISRFDALLALTQGDTYLLDGSSGESDGFEDGDA